MIPQKVIDVYCCWRKGLYGTNMNGITWIVNPESYVGDLEGVK